MYIKKIQFENMLIVEVKNGNVEQALKKLKNKVRNVKQVKMLRDRQEFTKPSVSKRLQKQKAHIAKRAEQGRAKTLDQLIELGKSRGYKYPVPWAKKIMASRHF